MRGLFFSTIYLVLLILTMYGISQVIGSINIPPHEDLPTMVGDIASIEMGKGGNPDICTVNIETFGDLSVLDRPEVIGC